MKITATEGKASLLLTKKQAGRELAISEPTIDRMIRQGLLPVVRFGGNVRIERADLRAFIQARKGVGHD